VSDGGVERVLVMTLESQPADAAHWSTRSMARASGLGQSAISRIWRAFGLQPHRSESFKLSPDPFFIEQVRDIVGPYLHPPDRAPVLCVDEQSQTQALDRTQPLPPMRPGQVEAHPRLPPPRHHHTLRRAGREDGRGDRAEPSPPPAIAAPRRRRAASRGVSTATRAGSRRPARSDPGAGPGRAFAIVIEGYDAVA
jgi:hypothetical protein